MYVGSLPSFTTTSYSLDLWEGLEVQVQILHQVLVDKRARLPLLSSSACARDPLLAVTAGVQGRPHLTSCELSEQQDEKTFQILCLYTREVSCRLHICPPSSKNEWEHNSDFKSNFWSPVLLVSLPVTSRVDSRNFPWTIHFPADISQAATTKNYKSNFGSDLHIYLFVQVLLEQKLLTFGMKIK